MKPKIMKEMETGVSLINGIIAKKNITEYSEEKVGAIACEISSTKKKSMADV